MCYSGGYRIPTSTWYTQIPIVKQALSIQVLTFFLHYQCRIASFTLLGLASCEEREKPQQREETWKADTKGISCLAVKFK
ncbi:hypothetical protein XF_1052 [Xylella fastidiosa 9a5c]|uniref:Uncharacterized protein n=1 Tax=Xylella fastidiosa (strain 9a5c) TaxID=160492 RepID=Q9PEH6_XYLFA|nr:hypothetical protein XF_1052 [Xylella fastidiosa 9a5c]